MSEHDPLAGARPGQRWVVRYRLPDGSATDVVGWLDALDPAQAHLATPDGRVQAVQRSAVVVARRAPAAAGGPPPERTSAEELERHTLPGWLARSEPLGEWTLRAGGGFTGRANSCLAIGDPGMPVAAAAQAVVAFAHRHGIAPRVQVVTGSAPEAALRALGWVAGYVPTDVLAVRLADFLAPDAPGAPVRVTEELEQGWWDAYGQSRPEDVDPALLRSILAGNPPRAFASAADASGTFAIGRGHLSGDWLGCAALWTRPDRRRAGWAGRVLAALGHWGARRGARYAYLQVASANTGAIAAYERLGFRHHHSYGYLVPPGDGVSRS